MTDRAPVGGDPPGGPRAALVVAAVELRRRLRDRSAVIQAVVAPVVIAVIVSTAFGGGTGAGGFEATIGVVDEDATALSAGLVGGLLGGDGAGDDGGGVSFRRTESMEAARAAVDDGDLSAAIVVPEGYAASVTDGQGADGTAPVPLGAVVAAEQRLAGEVAVAVAEGLAARVDTVRLAVATAAAAAVDDPSAAVAQAARDAAQQVATPVQVASATLGGDFDAAAYFGPSMAILFLFLTMGAGARSLLVERREGVLARVRAAPVPAAAVLAGKAAAVLVLGLVAFLVVWAVTAVGLGADWGQPVGVVLVIVAVVLAIAGISTVITGLARTEGQADGLTSTITFGLALLGGNFVSPGALPDALRTLSLATPNGWALRAFTDLSAGGAGVVDVLPALGVLLAVAVVTGGLGIGLLARRFA